jgi:hypothetical protein
VGNRETNVAAWGRGLREQLIVRSRLAVVSTLSEENHEHLVM